jgi:hypothetical protein
VLVGVLDIRGKEALVDTSKRFVPPLAASEVWPSEEEYVLNHYFKLSS